MSAVSVLPATVRLPRTVAVRRALLAGLFLVGFVALGFAFGPGAHAEDRTATRDLSGATAPVEGRAVDESASLSTGAPATGETSTPARAATRDGATDRLSRSETEFAQQRETARTEVAAHKDAADGAFAEAVRPAAEQAAPGHRPGRRAGDRCRGRAAGNGRSGAARSASDLRKPRSARQTSVTPARAAPRTASSRPVRGPTGPRSPPRRRTPMRPTACAPRLIRPVPPCRNSGTRDRTAFRGSSRRAPWRLPRTPRAMATVPVVGTRTPYRRRIPRASGCCRVACVRPTALRRVGVPKKSSNSRARADRSASVTDLPRGGGTGLPVNTL